MLPALSFPLRLNQACDHTDRVCVWRFVNVYSNPWGLRCTLQKQVMMNARTFLFQAKFSLISSMLLENIFFVSRGKKLVMQKHIMQGLTHPIRLPSDECYLMELLAVHRA